MRGVNENEALSFAQLTITHPVHIRFIEFMPVDIQSGWDKNYFIPNSEIQEQIEKTLPLISLPLDNKSAPAKMFQIKGALGKIGFISPLSNHFCSACNRMRLTSDGRLRTCLFSDNETNLSHHIRNNCTDKELEELIKKTILTKPEKHRAMEPSFKKCFRNMSAIGG